MGGRDLVSDENKLPMSAVSVLLMPPATSAILLSTVSAAPFMVSVALDKVDAGGNGASGKTSAVVVAVAVAATSGVGVGAVPVGAVPVGASAVVTVFVMGAPVCMSV
jgi:hypothetical protein